MKIVYPLLYCLILAGSGCASKEVTHERGWVGGSYAAAMPGPRYWRPAGRDVVYGLPKEVREKQAGAILVTDAPSKTPLERGGLRVGDLILDVNGKPMTNMRVFRKTVDAAVPGSSLKFSVYREGKILVESVPVGVEKFREEHMFTVGIGFPTTAKIDILPDPDFSLVALGYKHKEERLNLNDPKLVYARSLRAASTNTVEIGYPSGEGWNTWLAIFDLGEHKVILSQE